MSKIPWMRKIASALLRANLLKGRGAELRGYRGRMTVMLAGPPATRLHKVKPGRLCCIRKVRRRFGRFPPQDWKIDPGSNLSP
jgi:hypothetical protein